MTIGRTVVGTEIGQSYASALLDTAAYYGMVGMLRAIIINNNAAISTTLGISVLTTHGVQVHNYARAGSAIYQDFQGSTGYWVTTAYGSGTLLTAATTAIGLLATKPMFINHRHGQQDAAFIGTSADSQKTKTALPVIWNAMRTACGQINGQNVPIFVDMIGPRYDVDEMQEYYVRDRMLELISEQPVNHLYIGVDTYALQLGAGGDAGAEHPTDGPLGSYRLMGVWSGRKVGQWLIDKTEWRGPHIDSAVAVGSTVQVTIGVTTPGQTLVKPASPEFFGVWDSNGNRLEITGFAWSGSVLNIKTAGAPATLRYPARPTGTTTGAPMIDNVIRLNDPSAPLFVGETGLPLESTITISL